MHVSTVMPTLVIMKKNVSHYHSKMSTSSEMKKSTKDIRHLETTINQSTVEKFWTRTG